MKVTVTWLRFDDVECVRCRRFAGEEGETVYVVDGEAAFAWTASRSPNGCVPRNGRDRGVSVSGLGYHTLARTDGVPFRYRCPGPERSRASAVVGVEQW